MFRNTSSLPSGLPPGVDLHSESRRETICITVEAIQNIQLSKVAAVAAGGSRRNHILRQSDSGNNETIAPDEDGPGGLEPTRGGTVGLNEFCERENLPSCAEQHQH